MRICVCRTEWLRLRQEYAKLQRQLQKQTHKDKPHDHRHNGNFGVDKKSAIIENGTVVRLNNVNPDTRKSKIKVCRLLKISGVRALKQLLTILLNLYACNFFLAFMYTGSAGEDCASRIRRLCYRAALGMTCSLASCCLTLVSSHKALVSAFLISSSRYHVITAINFSNFCRPMCVSPLPMGHKRLWHKRKAWTQLGYGTGIASSR